MDRNDRRVVNRRALLKTGAVAGLAAGLTPWSGAFVKAATTELYYPSWMLGEAGVGDYWKASVAAFEKQHAGMTLDTTLIPSNDYEDKTLTQIAGGTIPDIYPVFTNMVPRLVSLDLLEPLDAYLAEAPWKSKELPAFKVAQHDGKSYGVVLTASPQGLIYNKQLLDQAGIGIPKTPDEFLSACQTVKKKTGQWGYVFPMDTSEVLNTYVTTMQWVLGFGSDWAQPDGTPSSNAPKTVEAMSFLQKFIDGKLVPIGMKVVNARALFKDGKVAFMIDGPWVLTYVKSDNPKLYPATGFDLPPTATHAAITGGAFFTIPKGSKHKDVAWDYINMINQESWQRRWLEDLVQVPGQDVTPSQQFLQANPWVKNLLEVAAKYQAGFGYSPPSPLLAPHADEFQKIVMGQVAQIWNGSKQVKPALDELQQQLVAWEKSNGITPGAS